MMKNRNKLPRKIMKEKPANIQDLKEIPDIPGYYVDVEKGEVWSFVVRSPFSSAKTWHKMKCYARKNQTFRTFSATVGGRCRCLSLGRSIFAAKHCVSYDHPSLDLYNFYAEKRKLEVKTKRDATAESVKMYRARINRKELRLKELVRTVELLQLVKDAYMGNYTPLLEYIHGREEYYILHLRGGSFRFSPDKAKIGCMLAKDRLMELIENGKGRVYDLDGWYIKTAAYEVIHFFKKNCRYIDISKMESTLNPNRIMEI